jgi:predicted nucleic acid-binding protein
LSVLVDTSAWIEYLRRTGSPAARWLHAALDEDRPLAWTEPVLLELMLGADAPGRATTLRSLVTRGPFLPVRGLETWESAASLWRAARSSGLTVRSSVDCLIAAVAVRDRTPLISHDRDFAALARVSPLALVDPRGA